MLPSRPKVIQFHMELRTNIVSLAIVVGGGEGLWPPVWT